jgi:hypothetical protein
MNDIFVILQILADPIFLGWDKDVQEWILRAILM